MRAWIPNLMTAARIPAAALIAWLLVAHEANLVAFWLFIAAFATDMLDGWVARKLGVHSPLGAALDAVADKLLSDTTWLALWWIGYAPAWLSLSMVGRDLLVVGGWSWARLRGRRWEARPLGQVMTALEAVALGVLLFHGPWWLDVHWPTVGMLLGGLTLLLAVASAVEYVARGPIPR